MRSLDVRWTSYTPAHLPRRPNVGTLQNDTQFTIVFRDCLEALHSKETFDGCPYREIPQANKVPMNQAEIIFSGAFVAVPRLLVLKQAHAQQEPKPGNAAAIFEWSECLILWCELQRTPFVGASCSIVSHYQAALILDTKLSRTVALYSGFKPTEEG